VDVHQLCHLGWWSDGPRMIFSGGGGDPITKGQIFLGGNQTVQCNIERENVALRCGCGVPVAE